MWWKPEGPRQNGSVRSMTPRPAGRRPKRYLTVRENNDPGNARNTIFKIYSKNTQTNIFCY